jgi:hypothetical protein
MTGSGRTPAEELLEDFRTLWKFEINPVFSDYAYYVGSHRRLPCMSKIIFHLFFNMWHTELEYVILS